MTLTLLPAVDVADGQAVRLVQGAAGSETAYGDPLEAALAWQNDGAEWVHLVDLDAAFGRGSNAALLAEVVGRLDVKVELSGGIRDDESLTRALATGAARVNIGTAALEDPEWCDRICGEYGDRVAIGLDVRGRTLSARGWTRDGGDLYEVLARLDKAGAARYVVTDITKDGTMRGPNLDLLREVCAATDKPVIASGGVSTLDDLRALATLEPVGVEGVIAGKALYAGAFTVREALDALEASFQASTAAPARRPGSRAGPPTASRQASTTRRRRLRGQLRTSRVRPPGGSAPRQPRDDRDAQPGRDQRQLGFELADVEGRAAPRAAPGSATRGRCRRSSRRSTARHGLSPAWWCP